MSRSINRVELLGHLGKDVEVKYTPTGIQVASFSIATSRSFKKQNSTEWTEVTDWHKCILWRCEKVAQFLLKGKQVFVAGRLQTRSYEDREGTKRSVTEVIVDELILLGGGGGSERPAGDRHAPADPPFRSGAEPEYAQGVTEDDVPF
jgi:single-strand DNA-binding protein